MRIATSLPFLMAVAAGCFAQGPTFPSIGYVAVGADYAALVGIPLGSIFSIVGGGLAPSPAQTTALPLPVSLNNVTVNLWDATSGGNFLGACPLWYVSPSQINAVLLSSLPAGRYYLSVSTLMPTPVGTSYPVESSRVQIMATTGRFAPFTVGSRGFGPAVIQQYDAQGGPFLNQFTSAAPAGSILTLWGTGLGPLPSGSDANATEPQTLRTDVTVYVDGIAATPTYAGRSPYLPGVDQINFALPPGVAPRCFVPIQVVTGGAASQIDTVAVSSGPDLCTSEFGLSSAALARLDAGGTVQAAVLNLVSTTAQWSGNVSQTAEAWAGQYDSAYLALLALGAHGAPVKGGAICSQGPPALFSSGGLNTSTGVPSPVVGQPGCSWQFSPLGSILLGQGACLASFFTFAGPPFSAGGAFPAPKGATSIASFSAQQSVRQITATWTASAAPGDLVYLTFGSFYDSISLFGSQQYSAEVSCLASPTDTPFALAPYDVAYAQQYSIPTAPSMSLVTTTDQVFPATSPFDFVLVRTANSAQDEGP